MRKTYHTRGLELGGHSTRLITGLDLFAAEVTPISDHLQGRQELGLNEREYDCVVRDDANVYGPLAVGVPGQMAGIGTLHESWGKLPWSQVVQPSLDLLADGVPFGASLVHSVNTLEAVIRRSPATAQHLLPNSPYPLCQTLDALQEKYIVFYQSAVAAPWL